VCSILKSPELCCLLTPLSAGTAFPPRIPVGFCYKANVRSALEALTNRAEGQPASSLAQLGLLGAPLGAFPAAEADDPKAQPLGSTTGTLAWHWVAL